MNMPVIITIAAGVPIITFAVTYNMLVAKENQIQNAFSSIDAMLQKRYDLIPNLVSTVKAYMEV